MDIYAQDDTTTYIGEAKYQEKVNPLDICDKLSKKMERILPAKGKKIEFVLVARSFSKRCNSVEGHTVHCFDLADIKGMLV